jgi:hypothetical protein
LPFPPLHVISQQVVFQEISGGVVFRIAHNGNPPATGNYYLAFGNIFLGIVGAFGVNVRPQQAYKLGDIRGVKDRNRINVTERRQNFRTLIARNARPAFAFESPGACVGIYGHNQPAAQLPGSAQITDVAHVKKIKASIGQDDLVSSRPPLPYLFCQFSGRKYFVCGAAQLSLHYGAQ